MRAEGAGGRGLVRGWGKEGYYNFGGNYNFVNIKNIEFLHSYVGKKRATLMVSEFSLSLFQENS